MTFPFGVTMLWVIALGCATFLVHACFAMAVYSDSQQLTNRLKQPIFLGSGGLWALAVLIGGVFVVGLYWLIHYSSLRPQRPSLESTESSSQR